MRVAPPSPQPLGRVRGGYYVYSETFPLDPMKAKELVCAAVRQWAR